MFTCRTPAKSQKDSDESSSKIESSQSSKVRRSLGEWESGALNTNPKTSTEGAAPVESLKIRPKKTLSQESKTVERRTSVDAAVSPSAQPKTKYIDRLSEAKACVTKAKLHLRNSRNIKTEIKVEVTHAVERLYQLVKESESVKGKKQFEETEKETGRQKEQDNEREKEREESDIKKKMEEHVKFIQKSNQNMEKLKEVIERHQEKLEAQKNITDELKKELREAVKEASSAPIDTPNLKEEIKNLNAVFKNTEAQLRAITLPPTLGTSPPTYAAIARRPVHVPPHHSLIVSSEDQMDTSTMVLDKVRGAVDAKTTGIRVDSVRKARDQKLVIGCRSRDDAKTLQTQIEQRAKGLTVIEARMKDPLVVIRDVLSYNTDDDILCSLKSQNTNTTGDIPDSEYRASVKYRRRARNAMESHIILQVSPRLWQKLMTVGEVYIDLQRRPVHDQSPLIQCTRCLGFGHGRKLCKESADLCSHCGEPHLRNDCPNWIAATPASCRNCKNAKAERHDHSAFSTECPIRRRWDSIARSSVAYHC